MSGWADSGTWEGDGLRREVFFFSSRGTELYGSWFASSEPTSRIGVLACPSWGTEADRTDPLVRAVVLEAARLGGAGLLFHYPGYGDSHGDLEGVALDDLTAAAVAALGEASRRAPGLTWILAGFMFGAGIACLAQRPAGVDRLLLVQPTLRPGAYFERLAKSRRPLASGPSPRQMMEVGSVPGMAYGYPIPRRIAERPDEADDAVGAALDAFDGRGAVVAHPTSGGPDLVPERFERTDVEGRWRFGSLNNPMLTSATTDWLRQQDGALAA